MTDNIHNLNLWEHLCPMIISINALCGYRGKEGKENQGNRGWKVKKDKSS